MKKILTIIFTLMVLAGNAQLQIKTEDLDNLVEISNMYAKENFDKAYFERLEQLRTPGLDNLISAMFAFSKHDTSLLNPRFLRKPPKKDLLMWYIVREICFNQMNKRTRPNMDVAKEVIAKEIDNKSLLDNYYYLMRRWVAYLFNTADLSKYDFITDTLDLKSKTDKSIFYFNIVSGCAQRFFVLNNQKKYNLILEFAAKMPKFDGKDYYYFTEFAWDDFQYIGYKNPESYKARRLGELYNVLIAHYNAISKSKKNMNWQDVYYNSILNMPEYFTYSYNQVKYLNDLHKKQGRKKKKEKKF